MKTLEQCKAEVQAVERELVKSRREGDAKASKRLQRELAELQTYCRYLATAPREEALKAQLEQLERRLKLNDERFGGWCAMRTGGRTELRHQYDTECETSKLKAQVRTLKYLLCL
jgi:hypothetical protein